MPGNCIKGGNIMAWKNLVSSAAVAVVGGGVALAAGSVVGSQGSRSGYSNSPLCAELEAKAMAPIMNATALSLYAAQSERLGCDPGTMARIIIDKK